MIKRGRQVVAVATSILVVIFASVLLLDVSQPKDDAPQDQVISNRVSMDFIDDAGMKTVTSTMKGWPVSLDVPHFWKTTVEYSTVYNYGAKKKETVNVITIAHPSDKLHIVLQQYPLFSADGVCGATTLTYLHKETMEDDRLTFVEAVGEGGAFFLKATTNQSASIFTEDFNSCFSYRELINSDAQGVNLQTEDRPGYYEKPFVSIGIRPAFVLDEHRNWGSQDILNFLTTEEYLEVKQIVKKLQI